VLNMLEKSIIDQIKTVELPFFVERTCTDCDTNEKSINLRPESKKSSSFRSASSLARRKCCKEQQKNETETETGEENRKKSRCHPNANLKLNRNRNRLIDLCKCNRMAKSCIYFVLVLAILSLGNTSAAFHQQQQPQHNYNNTINNYNYYNGNIDNVTQNSAGGLLDFNERSNASAISATDNDYSIYHD